MFLLFLKYILGKDKLYEHRSLKLSIKEEFNTLIKPSKDYSLPPISGLQTPHCLWNIVSAWPSIWWFFWFQVRSHFIHFSRYPNAYYASCAYFLQETFASISLL